MTAVERFSTRGLAESTRVERWEDHNARALVGLECRTLTDAPLDATEITLQLNELQLAHVSANPHVVERTERRIAASAVDGVALYFTLAGESFFYHRDGVHLVRPGSLLVCDVNEPFMRGFAHGLQEFVLRVPRSVFEPVSDRPISHRPMTMTFGSTPGANAHAGALARLIKGSLEQSVSDLAQTEREACDLLRAIFSTDEARSSAAHRRSAIRWIEQHLREPTLSVARVASAIGVSERQLSRAFGETGTGLARLILEMRLDLAHGVLARRTEAPIGVGEVAAYAGFASHSHFSRVYRERFEETPADTQSRSLR